VTGRPLKLPSLPDVTFKAPQGSEILKIGLMVFLNVLWCGLGNVAIGDKNGWTYVLLNIPILIASFFTFFIPSIAFFFVCWFQGWQHIVSHRMPSFWERVRASEGK